ncbi:unnamed protein product [Meganyctiphanes norvegica]|uniref:ETS domain-containing protein n=1 Tax=Meganyctiphanes norvegica TaxID=48144 RepID=A0AAV2SBW6_MEGNR
MPITYVSKKSTHLPEPSAQCKLPELLPLEDFEDEEEDEADIRVGRFSFNRFKLKDKEDLIEDVLEKITIPTSRKGRGVRGPKNWEFLMRLLADLRANPMLIKWEDQESYTFRLVEPDIIMDIWNSKSKRAPVDYNSFARGLRYHYKRGALTLVREHQMVYGCGPIAINLLHKLMRRNAEKPNSSPSFFRPWI